MGAAARRHAEYSFDAAGLSTTLSRKSNLLVGSATTSLSFPFSLDADPSTPHLYIHPIFSSSVPVPSVNTAPSEGLRADGPHVENSGYLWIVFVECAAVCALDGCNFMRQRIQTAMQISFFSFPTMSHNSIKGKNFLILADGKKKLLSALCLTCVAMESESNRR